MYITMMGADGLAAATVAAILNANYIAARLKPHYPLLFTGATGRVAHSASSHPSAQGRREFRRGHCKAADRLLHAPTVSFPVAGTLMVEPTNRNPRSSSIAFAMP
jgi:glycine dehydrogenase